MTEHKKKTPESVIIADDITRDCNGFEAWFIQNGKLVAWGCVVVIILVAAYFTVSQLRKSAEAKYLATFAAATTQIQLEDALKKYPEGEISCEGRVRLAKLYMKAKNNKAALEQFALISADPKAPAFTKGRAILDAGYLHENDGKLKDALAQYEKAASNLELAEDTRCEGYYAAGRMQVILNNNAKARAAFKQAMPAQPRSMATVFWRSQAQAALERLPADLPAKK